MAQKLTPIKASVLLWFLGLVLLFIGLFLKPIQMVLQSEKQSHSHNYSQKRISKPSYPVQQFERKEGEIWLKSGQQVTDTLRMEQWSKLFHLPPNHRFLMDVTQEFHGIRFSDGTEWDRARILEFLKSRDGWMSTISSASFRLRGRGVVTITVGK